MALFAFQMIRTLCFKWFHPFIQPGNHSRAPVTQYRPCPPQITNLKLSMLDNVNFRFINLSVWYKGSEILSTVDQNKKIYYLNGIKFFHFSSVIFRQSIIIFYGSVQAMEKIGIVGRIWCY